MEVEITISEDRKLKQGREEKEWVSTTVTLTLTKCERLCEMSRRTRDKGQK